MCASSEVLTFSFLLYSDLRRPRTRTSHSHYQFYSEASSHRLMDDRGTLRPAVTSLDCSHLPTRPNLVIASVCAIRCTSLMSPSFSLASISRHLAPVSRSSSRINISNLLYHTMPVWHRDIFTHTSCTVRVWPALTCAYSTTAIDLLLSTLRASSLSFKSSHATVVS